MQSLINETVVPENTKSGMGDSVRRKNLRNDTEIAI